MNIRKNSGLSTRFFLFGHSVRKVRGLLEAMGLEKKIRIAFDEWNLRGWYHPGIHTIPQAVTKDEYLKPPEM